MNWDEYNKLFHKHQLNLVAFRRLMDCGEEVLRVVNAAIEQEREACAKVCEGGLPIASSLNALDDMEMWGEKFAAAIRARGQS